MRASPRDRALSALSSVALVGALGWALVAGLGVSLPRAAERALETFSVLPTPPPPPEPVVPEPVRKQRPEGDAAPPNIRSQATQVVAPEPVVLPPEPPPVIAAPISGVGSAPTQGAADVPGPGTGAGGQGSGTGAGGSGDGDGGGWEDETPPRRIRGRLGNDTLPDYLRDRDGLYTVGVRYRVGTDGRVSECEVTASSGHPALDRNTCVGIERGFRYRPALDGAGRPVPSRVAIDYDFEIDEE